MSVLYSCVQWMFIHSQTLYITLDNIAHLIVWDWSVYTHDINISCSVIYIILVNVFTLKTGLQYMYMCMHRL